MRYFHPRGRSLTHSAGRGDDPAHSESAGRNGIVQSPTAADPEDRIAAFNRILTQLGRGGTPEDIAEAFLAGCRQAFDAATGSIVLVDAATGATRTLASGPGTAPAVATIEAPVVVGADRIGSVALERAGHFATGDAETLTALAVPLAMALERAISSASLAESELKYRSLVAQAEEMIFVIDGESLRILEANDYTCRVLGYSREELLTLTADQLVLADSEDVRTRIRETIERGEQHIADRAYRRKDGTLLDVDVLTSVLTYGGRQAVLALVRDVSEQKAMQAQLIQGQKMESLGLMAGSLAHDFNNLLTTILGFAGLLKRSSNMSLDERENLGLIEDASRRAADLTGRLLAFARGGLVRFGPVDLCAVVDDTLALAGPSLHNNVEVVTLLPPEPVLVEGDASQVQQALLNIVLNARDAMPDGGRITIALESNDAASLTVADTGSGMTEEVRTRIFEPFYTTKPIGAGTGLGLAIAYGIVQGHHGDIAVESAPGAGTMFTITLPLLSANTASQTADEAFNPGEGNLVLVVDDDEMVRRATSATLASLGYNVVEAPGGATAVQVVEARPDRISAVLLDLVMPGMTGSETFRALTALRPDLPIIVCTGYAADAHIDADLKRRIAGLVQKPFTPERLGRALSEAGVTPNRR